MQEGPKRTLVIGITHQHHAFLDTQGGKAKGNPPDEVSTVSSHLKRPAMERARQTSENDVNTTFFSSIGIDLILVIKFLVHTRERLQTDSEQTERASSR